MFISVSLNKNTVYGIIKNAISNWKNYQKSENPILMTLDSDLAN